MSDEELALTVRLAREGDSDAFDKLVKLFDSRLQYYVGRFTRDNDLREDIVQQAWVSVYFNLRKLRADEAFVSWLYTITRRKMVAELKLKHSLDARFAVSLDDAPAESAAIAPDEGFTKEEAAEVHAALEALPAPQREALVLRFIEEMTYEQIAEVSRVSIGTVRSRIFYGKQGLKDIIQRTRTGQP